MSRKRNCKGRTSAGGIADGHFAAVNFSQLQSHAESQTEVIRIGAAGGAAVEAVEDALLFAVRHHLQEGQSRADGGQRASQLVASGGDKLLLSFMLYGGIILIAIKLCITHTRFTRADRY